MTLNCIVLAAGRARRFGSQKLLASLANGVSVAEASAMPFLQSSTRVVAVIRDDPLLRAMYRRLGIDTIVNPHADDGMGSSIACGVSHCAEAGGWLIGLADMPHIAPATVASIITTLQQSGGIVVPAYQGQRGHPVGFDRSFFSALTALRGDAGARAVVSQADSKVTILTVADAGILQDVDVPADLVER